MRMSVFLDDRYGNIKNMFFETFFKDFRIENPRSPFKKTAAEFSGLFIFFIFLFYKKVKMLCNYICAVGYYFRIIF